MSNFAKVGDMIPDIAMTTPEGGTVKPSDFTGQKLVLFFYPKDDTPGCTTEACNFRDHYSTFSDAVVLGVSPDNVKSHEKFKAKFKLPFPLLADPDHAVAEKYGVWKEKSMYGKKYMGIERTTFIIDTAGKIARIFPKVKVAEHYKEVREALDGI